MSALKGLENGPLKGNKRKTIHEKKHKPLPAKDKVISKTKESL